MYIDYFCLNRPISDLIKSDDPSPFPALSQIEVYGYEVE